MDYYINKEKSNARFQADPFFNSRSAVGGNAIVDLHEKKHTRTYLQKIFAKDRLCLAKNGQY